LKVAALFSGGKDSSLAIQRVLESGHEVTNLVSIFSKNPESYMFHYPNIHMTELQAEAAEIPLIKKISEGVKEEELKDLDDALGGIRQEIEAVVLGAIESSYQRDRVLGALE
jgi:uncharacterized protein (TIGR00290 family)